MHPHYKRARKPCQNGRVPEIIRRSCRDIGRIAFSDPWLGYRNSCGGSRLGTMGNRMLRNELRIASSSILVALGMVFGTGPSSAQDNLDFHRGTLEGWEGSGFYLTAGQPSAPGAAFGACSSDAGAPTRKGMLRYVFTVPPDAELLVCQAFAATRPGVDSDGRLDVVLSGADKTIVPKRVRGSA